MTDPAFFVRHAREAMHNALLNRRWAAEGTEWTAQYLKAERHLIDYAWFLMGWARDAKRRAEEQAAQATEKAA